MRRHNAHQPDLFLIVEPPENKLPSSERPQVLQLLGELMSSVLERRPTETTREEANDE